MPVCHERPRWRQPTYANTAPLDQALAHAFQDNSPQTETVAPFKNANPVITMLHLAKAFATHTQTQTQIETQTQRHTGKDASAIHGPHRVRIHGESNTSKEFESTAENQLHNVPSDSQLLVASGLGKQLIFFAGMVHACPWDPAPRVTLFWCGLLE